MTSPISLPGRANHHQWLDRHILKDKTMSAHTSFSLTEVIQRSLITKPEDVTPLVKYLGMEEVPPSPGKEPLRLRAELIAKHLCEMGSNSFATLIGETADYPEVVIDVAHKLDATGAHSNKSVEENEAIILQKLFADALEKMSEDEKRALFSSMGINEQEFPAAPTGVLLVQLLLNKFGGFAVYRMSLIVANFVSKAVLGYGLAFAANSALVRVVGMVLGPIGWIASGLWLAYDLAGPAFRKTVPAVVHVAMLRQFLTNRVTIGVVGDGSTGKDSMIHAVFGLDTGNVHPVAGSTKDATIYDLGTTGAVQLVNFPGFNDHRDEVNQQVRDMLCYADVFILVIDISRGVSADDVEVLKRLQKLNRPILVCLNKIDLPRPASLQALLHAAQDRLVGVRLVETSFDPDPRLGNSIPVNCRAVHEWVVEEVAATGKETSHIPKSDYI